MAYSIEISKPKCRCGKRATVQVFNRYNALVGNFCKKCGEAKVKELDKQ
jgi:hypothetical protein